MMMTKTTRETRKPPSSLRRHRQLHYHNHLGRLYLVLLLVSFSNVIPKAVVLAINEEHRHLRLQASSASSSLASPSSSSSSTIPSSAATAPSQRRTLHQINDAAVPSSSFTNNEFGRLSSTTVRMRKKWSSQQPPDDTTIVVAPPTNSESVSFKDGMYLGYQEMGSSSSSTSDVAGDDETSPVVEEPSREDLFVSAKPRGRSDEAMFIDQYFAQMNRSSREAESESEQLLLMEAELRLGNSMSFSMNIDEPTAAPAGTPMVRQIENRHSWHSPLVDAYTGPGFFAYYFVANLVSPSIGSHTPNASPTSKSDSNAGNTGSHFSPGDDAK